MCDYSKATINQKTNQSFLLNSNTATITNNKTDTPTTATRRKGLSRNEKTSPFTASGAAVTAGLGDTTFASGTAESVEAKSTVTIAKAKTDFTATTHQQ